MAYQDDHSHKHEVDKEVSSLSESRRCCLKAASIRVQEVRIQDQAHLRSREEESCDASPDLRKHFKREDVVFEEEHIAWTDDAHPYGHRKGDSRCCDCSKSASEVVQSRISENLAYLEIGGAAQNMSAADIFDLNPQLDVKVSVGVEYVEVGIAARRKCI